MHNYSQRISLEIIFKFLFDSLSLEIYCFSSELSTTQSIVLQAVSIYLKSENESSLLETKDVYLTEINLKQKLSRSQFQKNACMCESKRHMIPVCV